MATRGLTLVFTGNGKGKTTAALGMAMRAWGQGMRILVLQFIKGNWNYGELKTAEKLGENFIIRQAGEGFVRGASEEQLKEHRRAAHEALEAAGSEMLSGEFDMIVLDEINYAVHFGLINKEEVLHLIEQKPEWMHLVLTGRNLDPEISQVSDMVSEISDIKHHMAQGVKAQSGVEF